VIVKVFEVDPVSKPRMTRRDVWKKRPCVLRYHAYKDRLLELAAGWVPPKSGAHIMFMMPMPKSWSKKKKDDLLWRPHQQRPDIDNLHKAFLDAFFQEDSEVWDCRITKMWATVGSVKIMYEMREDEEDDRTHKTPPGAP
jgi:Holliday junction resolvase RusA-like endonuclease